MAGQGEGSTYSWFGHSGLIVAAAILVLALVVGVASALGDGQSANGVAGLPTTEDMIRTIESVGASTLAPNVTDPRGAENSPHGNLGRAEAVELLESVFGTELESPAGVFDELEVERFLTPNVAIVPGSQGVEEEEPSGSNGARRVSADEIQEQVAGATLLASTLPLGIEGPSGSSEPVDLSLERSEGELQPAAPLVEVGVPEELGQGIQLPGPGVRIELAEAPQGRSPSTVDESVAVYPNVAEDTDLAVALTPTGVETLTQIRSAEAPRTQTFDLHVPAGDSLEATPEGGAVVTRGDKTLVGVAPPTALDATGKAVPVELSIAGDSLTWTVSPDESNAYPILIDPLFQVYEWSRMTNWEEEFKDGICRDSFEIQGSYSCVNREEWGYEDYDHEGGNAISIGGQFWGESPYVAREAPGLYIAAHGPLTGGFDRGTILYTVPRFFTDQKQGQGMPTSFIAHLTLSDLIWQAYNSSPSPYLFAGIWDPVSSNWVSYYSHTGLSEHGLNETSYQYQFENATNPDTHAKAAEVSVVATETQPGSAADVYVGDATVELGDNEAPGPPVPPPPTGWLNQTSTNITVSDEDSGLGMSAFTASTEQLGGNGQPLHSWKASYGCLGVADAACPRKWTTSESGHPHLTIEPALLPTGIDYLNLVAEDPVGNRSQASYAEVKIDHTAPEVALSGTATEIAAVGSKHPTYGLKVDATDGSAEAPQSGVTKVVVEFDGQVVKREEAACGAENCSMSPEWTIESARYAAGRHTIKVTATDAVGNTAARILQIELDPSPPTLSLSGTMTEQATLGTTRPRYRLRLDASTDAGLERSSAPEFSANFGTWGLGNGQFRFPSDVARDSKGDLWVADWNNDRVEEFDEAGEYVSQFGSEGSGAGQLRQPTALAVDAKGDLWVVDSGNDRVEEFNEKGEYLRQFGSKGTGDGQFTGPGPDGIAVAPSGDIWVSDTYGARLEEFDEKGEFVRAVGSRGSGPGQLSEPMGIDVAPDGDVYVSDWVDDRVEEYGEKGEYLRQFGSEGSGAGQFEHPDALAVDPDGHVWVGDTYDGRVEEFTGEGGYLTRFGTPGEGAGQLGYGNPMGIALDGQGDIWVADSEDDRVEHWQVPGFAPAYSRTIGHEGDGAGSLISPRGVAAPLSGDVWVADTGRGRIQEFGARGEFLRQFGSYGTGAGQFRDPSAIVQDPEGHLWVADSENNRVQEFDTRGELLLQFGTHGSGAGQLSGPRALAIGPEGELWVADTANDRIEEFDPEGHFVRQVGGYGTGNGQFAFPSGIAVDPAGDVWVADTGDDRLQEFNAKGEFIRAVGSAGEGEGRFDQPDGIAIGPEGDLWVADSRNDRVQQLGPKGEYLAQYGSAGDNAGQFFEPMGVTVDYKGDVWVADTRNDRVQEITGGEFIRQFGGEGTGPGRLSLPHATAVDAAGDVWVADTADDRVQEFGPGGGFIRQFGGKGSHPGEFSDPEGIAVGPEGEVWVADTGNHRVEEFTAKGAFVSQVDSFTHELTPEEVEEGEEEEGRLEDPIGIAVDADGDVWVVDAYGTRVVELDPEGKFIRQIGATGPERQWVGCEGGDGLFCVPEGIAVGPDGEVWVSDTGNDRLQEFTAKGEFVRKVGFGGEGEGRYDRPAGVAVGPEGEVFVADPGNDRIQQFGPEGGYLGRYGSSGDEPGQFYEPMGVTVDGHGNLWVVDTRNDRVQEISAGEFVQQFGGEASGPGHLAGPHGLTVGAEGELWVTDPGHERVQEFDATGEFVRQFGTPGSGDGQFDDPAAVAAGPEGDVWVLDSRNCRIQEFNAKGEFLRRIGSLGSGAGQLEAPEGIATDAAGDLWVADTYNNRIEEFGPEGAFIRQFGTHGTGNGQFDLPQDVAVGPGGEIWVADTENDRVEEFTAKGEYVRQFGSRGSAGGQLSLPKGVAVGPEGNVFVTDTGDDRIEEFSGTGAYLGHFGTAGDGEGQLSGPSGVVVDSEGEIWVTDTGNDRVEGWSRSDMRSEVATEVTVDGRRVDADSAHCVGERCPVDDEWVLESPEYEGVHTVVVTATDGLGNTTRKTLHIEVHPDATRPEVETGGSLMKAPEGWVEQEGYGFTATAKDAGYGVTSLALKIDGETVASSGHACHEGGCEAAIQKTVDMAPYSGGAHDAELVATDGAGNTTTKKWTINVDPSGRITSTEAEQTLEAADETSGSTIVAPTKDVLEPEQIKGGDDPGLQQNGSEIKSTGVPDETKFSTDLSEGFTMQSPEGTVTITPIVSEGSSKVSIAEEVAGVAANTKAEVDSIIRPEYNGAETFQAIRSSTSPETYSWTVNLEGGETLRLANSSQAEVLYKSGHLAYLITAEYASDAIGTTVPTSLSVSGNVLTLTVEFHSGSFVYPIVAGQGWEGGYRVPVRIEGPEDEVQVKEREQREREATERRVRELEEAGAPLLSLEEAEKLITPGPASKVDAPAPEPDPKGGATGSKIRTFEIHVYSCAAWHLPGEEPCEVYIIRLYNAKFIRWYDGAERLVLPPMRCEGEIPQAGWRLELTIGLEEDGLGWHVPYTVHKGGGQHLIAYCYYEIKLEPLAEFGSLSGRFSLLDFVYSNGFQEAVVRELAPKYLED